MKVFPLKCFAIYGIAIATHCIAITFSFQLYYRDAHVAVVVFAMNDLKSLHSANNWKTQVLRHLSNKDDIKIPVLLVGNKVYATV